MSKRAAFKLFSWLGLTFTVITVITPYVPSATVHEAAFFALIGLYVPIAGLVWRYAPPQVQ